MSSSPTERVIVDAAGSVGGAASSVDGAGSVGGADPSADSAGPTNDARAAEGVAAATDIVMPQMGTSMVEGTIVAWRVAVGDVVERDDLLCDVSTDKVDVECPAPAGGVVAAILVEAGETVDVGTVIARLAPSSASGASGAVASPSVAPSAPSADDALARGNASVAAPGSSSPQAGPPDSADRRETLRRSSPVASRLAVEHGLDVRLLRGSGRNGRVTKHDVLRAAEDAAAATPAPMHTESPYRHDASIPVVGAPGPGATADGGATPVVGSAPDAGTTPVLGATPAADAPPTGPVVPSPASPPVVPSDLGGVAEPLSRMRRSIGAAVRRSLDTAAHCTTVVECDMSRIERERRELGLTALPLLARHAIDALREFPALNATFDGETVTRYGDRVHLGIAVSLGDGGLIAPVIHDAQDLSVAGLARRIKDVAARARAGTLSPDEVHGGTFTITNPGAAGALMATPVINQPQVAILDLEAIVRRPVVLTDDDGGESIAIRPMVHLCMGWDHRALDGLYAAQFLTRLRRGVEG